MNDGRMTRTPRLEFRIPISPTEGFYSQVRFFDFALRRLGEPYRSARLLVVVGDNCNIEDVKRQNAWSRTSNVSWLPVPEEIFSEFGIHGTANWRFVPEAEDADIVILSDADTVMLRDVDPLLASFRLDRPAISGHMAHRPPPAFGASDFPNSHELEFWPRLMEVFDAPMPPILHPYSMDESHRLPLAPPYFNLGFVVLNRAAIGVFRHEIFPFERRFKALFDNHMRCQIACTIIAHRHAMSVDTLPAVYNAANDMTHMKCNGIEAHDIRVLHYLRLNEVNRQSDLLPQNLATFIDRPLRNPANVALQRLARMYADSMELSTS